MSKTARHMRQLPGPSKRPPIVRAVIIILLSILGSALLEAGTLSGSMSHSVFDLSMWMPKRMAVFFALLVPVNAFIVWTSLRRPFHRRISDTVFAGTKRILSCTIGVAAGIGLGYVTGPQLASALGNAGDVRYTIAVSATFIATLLLAANYKVISRKAEWGFLILALAFGTAYCLLMPTAAEISWDGQIHFNYANAMSYVFDAEYSGADILMTIGGEEGALFLTGAQESVEHLDVELNSRNVSFPHANLDENVVNSSNDAFRQAEETQPIVREWGTTKFPQGSYVTANMLGRIPNAIGLWIGRALHLDCIGRYTASRLFNLFVYAVVFFFAIRALKNGKLIMATIGLCPTALFEAANFSYDPWSISFLSLSMGLFVGKLQKNNQLTPWDTLQCLIPFVLGAYVRAVVFPLALIFVLVPRRRFSSAKLWMGHLLLVLIGMGLLLSSFAIPYLTSFLQGTAASDDRGGTDVNAGQQVAYVLSHPVETLKMGFLFGLRMLNPANLGLALDPSDENLMYYFPYLITTEAPLNEILAPTEFVLLGIVSLCDGGLEDEHFSAARYKIGAVISTCFAFTLLCGALYVGFTSVGRDTIAGVQQRYLLGLLSSFLLLVPNIDYRRKYKRRWLLPSFFAAETILFALVTWNSFIWAF